MDAFERAFSIVVGEEGGYVNDSRDPGGETRYGISKRAYPNEDIRGMTLDRARHLYKRDYWDRVRGDELPWPWALAAFDSAVNQGVAAATTMMQDALGVMADGVIGPRTLAAAQAAARDPEDRKHSRFMMKRARRYAANRNFAIYGDGWLTRLFLIARHAAA